MLASFGFQWNDPETASHSHANCNCRVVSEFEGNHVEVDGYDPAGMYERYNKCSDALGGRDGIREDWNALTEKERAKRIAKYGSESEAFEKYLNQRMAAEIQTRDPDWFKNGTRPKAIFRKPEEALEPHERKGVRWLLDNGIVPTTLVEDPNAVANLDVSLNGRPYEMKNVSNAGSSVGNQLGRIREKWWKLGNPGQARAILTMDNCNATIDEVVKAVTERRGYKEVIVIGGEGMVRIRK